MFFSDYFLWLLCLIYSNVYFDNMTYAQLLGLEIVACTAFATRLCLIIKTGHAVASYLSVFILIKNSVFVEEKLTHFLKWWKKKEGSYIHKHFRTFLYILKKMKLAFLQKPRLSRTIWLSKYIVPCYDWTKITKPHFFVAHRLCHNKKVFRVYEPMMLQI